MKLETSIMAPENQNSSFGICPDVSPSNKLASTAKQIHIAEFKSELTLLLFAISHNFVSSIFFPRNFTLF